MHTRTMLKKYVHHAFNTYTHILTSLLHPCAVALVIPSTHTHTHSWGMVSNVTGSAIGQRLQ